MRKDYTLKENESPALEFSPSNSKSKTTPVQKWVLRAENHPRISHEYSNMHPAIRLHGAPRS